MVFFLSSEGVFGATPVASNYPGTLTNDDCQQSGRAAQPFYPTEVDLLTRNGLNDRYIGLRQATGCRIDLRWRR